MAAAFYIKSDFPIITNNDRSDIQTMRSHRSDSNRFAMGHDNRTTDTQRISRGTGRGGYHQPVSLISGEMGTVDSSMNADH